jgi:hypothetical protein
VGARGSQEEPGGLRRAWRSHTRLVKPLEAWRASGATRSPKEPLADARTT